MNKPPLPEMWRITELIHAEKPTELFLTWESRVMFQRTCQFLLDHATPVDSCARTINLNVLDADVQAIGYNVAGMLLFLQRYRVIWMRRTLSRYTVKFQEPVITEFLECSPQELEPSLLAWRKRRELHTQMLKEKRKTDTQTQKPKGVVR